GGAAGGAGGAGPAPPPAVAHPGRGRFRTKGFVMVLAIYAGSFDPVTFGHLDLIERAARAFEELEVVVGSNPAKQYVFSLDERLHFLRQAIRHPRVRARKIENQLLADYAYEAGAAVIVKGVRGIQDYDYERMMHEINLTQQRGIDTHILIGRRELNHVSSSAVKQLCRYQGLTHEYVPLLVKEALERRLNGQAILGVTGGIGCGKSFLAEQLVAAGRGPGPGGPKIRPRPPPHHPPPGGPAAGGGGLPAPGSPGGGGGPPGGGG